MDPSDAVELTGSFVDPMVGGNGTTITFTRVTGISPLTTVTATCFGFVRDYRPQEIVAGSSLLQGDSNITIEGNALPALAQRLGTPPRATDKVSYAGFQRTVVSADPLKIGDTVVRINLQVRG